MPDEAARFVLVHGAFHGGWAWDALLPHLAALGHEALALDLPSHGGDPADPSAVTLDDYVARVTDAIRPGDILVGHSLGGLTVTLAADLRATDLRAVIYIAALMPRPHRALRDDKDAGATPELNAASRIDRATGTVPPRPDLVPLFYHDCSDAAAQAAFARLTPQPAAIMLTTLPGFTLHPNRFFIRCLKDRAIKPDYQARISADWGTGHTVDMPTGHSPFLSDPASLAKIMDGIART